MQQPALYRSMSIFHEACMKLPAHALVVVIGGGIVVNDAGVVDDAFIARGNYQIDVAGTQVEARVQLQALYDPASARIRA